MITSKKIAQLFSVSTDELLDYQKSGALAAVIEPVDLTKYDNQPKDGTLFDAIILDKCGDADEIISIYRTPRLKWYEHIFDFIIGSGTLEVARSVDTAKQLNSTAFYLVVKQDRQWIAEITQQTMTRRELTQPFSGKRLNLGDYTYHRNYGSGAVLMKK